MYRTCISRNKEQAIDEVETDADAKVLTDGACSVGYIGAAAALCKEGAEEQKVKPYMGTKGEHFIRYIGSKCV